MMLGSTSTRNLEMGPLGRGNLVTDSQGARKVCRPAAAPFPERGHHMSSTTCLFQLLSKKLDHILRNIGKYLILG